MSQEKVFVINKHDDVPLHRNVTPITECKVASSQAGDKQCSAVEVPMLTCASGQADCRSGLTQSSHQQGVCPVMAG